jgi:hypothetical protein
MLYLSTLDIEHHRALREGEAQPPNAKLVFHDKDHGGDMQANSAARQRAAEFCEGWHKRYKSGSALWVVRVPGGYAIIPNETYVVEQNRPWKVACEWGDGKL